MSRGWLERRERIRRGYVVASLILIIVHPLLGPVGGGVTLFVAVGGAAACVAIGRRDVEPGRREPWTLLLWALAALTLSNITLLAPDARIVGVGWLIDAVGNTLALVAALALIVHRGARDLGGIADAAAIALAAGIVLWAVLPRRLSSDSTFPAQVDLFVAVFALTGGLGALLRLNRTAAGPRTALRWLLAAISLAIGGNIVSALGGAAAFPTNAADMMFMAAFTAVGLFGLDPSGPHLMHQQALSRVERLSIGRLVFLGTAVATVSTVAGAHALLDGNPGGVMLTLEGALVAAVVMLRIGILGAERARAEQALEHQANHDPLTQLINRRQFVTCLRDELDTGAACAVLFCDLDGFKAINDNDGHDAGDRLLVEVADRLRTCVEPPHLVSRFGGDEFAALLVDVSEPQAEFVRDCITTAFGRPFTSIEEGGVGVSVGIAYSGSGRDPEQLIKEADHAMYEMKTGHRDTSTGQT